MHSEALTLRQAIGSRAEDEAEAFQDLAITILRDDRAIERKLKLIAGADLPTPVAAFLEKHAASPVAILVANIAMQHAAGDISDATWRELLIRLRPVS